MSSSVGEFVFCLPTADRRRALAFYRDALGLDAFGEPAADGVPEPLQFRLGDRAMLMLVPTDGLGWVLGGRAIAPPGVSECLLSLTVGTEPEVADVVERVRRAGGEVVAEPGHQPWGYSATWADPDGHAWQVTAGPPGDGS